MKKQTVLLLLLLQRTLFGFTNGVLLYMLSAYFMQVSGRENVGIFFLIASAGTLLFLLTLHHIVALIGRTKLLIGLIIDILLITGLLVFYSMSSFGIVLVLLYLVAASIVIVVLDMIMEAFSSDAEDGRAYGALATFFHMGFIIGPFFAGCIVEWNGFSGIFLVILIAYSIMFVLAVISVSHLPRLHNITRDDTIVLIRRAWSLEWFRHSYLLAIAIRFFYAVMVVYMPLYLLNQGFTLAETGTLFTVMLIPFLLIEYPAGVLADRMWGEREMLLVGIIIMIISVLVIIFVPLVGAVMWGSVLIFSRVGAALLEGMSDIFFYKHVQDENVGLIDLYRTASSVAYIAAMSFVGVLLFFIDDSFRLAFGAVIVVLFVGLRSAWCLHDTVSLTKK